MGIIPAIGVAGTAASIATRAFRKNKGIHGKVRNVSDYYRNQKPVGYLTDEDYAFSERGRERGARAIGKLATQRRGDIVNRQTARGMAYSPATEFLYGQSEQDEAEQLTDLERSTQDRLYGLRLNREGFERQRLMTAWGAELGAIQSDYQGQQAATASFWNSILPNVEDAISYFGGGGPSAGGGYGNASGFDLDADLNNQNAYEGN